jgi:hypothetical protein
MIQPVYDNLVALAGGGQAGATALREGINRVVTVATAADSAGLPQTGENIGETVIFVPAAAANARTVYPAPGEFINALSANTGISVAANRVIAFYCTSPGRWHSQLTA